MPWSAEKWWKGVAITTLALELICLVIGPNPLSIILIPIGMLLLGLAAPSVFWSWEKVKDSSRDLTDRAIGLFGGLFAFGIAKLGFDLAWSGVLASLVALSWKLDGN